MSRAHFVESNKRSFDSEISGRACGMIGALKNPLDFLGRASTRVKDLEDGGFNTAGKNFK
jgi:hypothetical protein